MNTRNINSVNNSVSPAVAELVEVICGGIGGVIRHSIPIVGHLAKLLNMIQIE